MFEQRVEAAIFAVLTNDTQKNALDFTNYLRLNDMAFEHGKGYWEDKHYWMIKHEGEYVCFILIGGNEGKSDSWTIWSDDSGSKWFADFPLDEHTKKTAYTNVDFCGNCGSCNGGTTKTIFGKTFDNVCLTTFKFDNPDSEAVECMKKLTGIRKNDIVKNSYASRIIPLEKDKWQDFRFDFNYTSHSFYDIEINRSDSGFDVLFVKKPFAVPYENRPDENDRLFDPWWDDVKAWGIEENGTLIAIIETAVEEWSNRLRVTELWVDAAYRRRGIASALMDVAVKRAKDEKRRVVMLETQSRNETAIAFYLDYGFTLIGFDACAYGNDDLNRKEVRMEMGIFINRD
jgi:ribosomal protein S18 acetylase RimI-like enzyme